jgi:hemoglobin
VALLPGTVVVAALAACAQGGGSMMGEKPTAAAPASLYDRLGGKPGVTAVVDDFVGNVAADPRIKQRFAHANIPFLKSSLVDQICQATGGPCQYTGPDMRTVHSGVNITDDEFSDLVQDRTRSLDRFKAKPDGQKELLAALGALRPQIVAV